jgi:transcriptional regulator GlxA family with amidase domain
MLIGESSLSAGATEVNRRFVEARADKVRVAIAAPESALAWTILGPCDMLNAVGPDWHIIRGGTDASLFEVAIVGASLEPVTCFKNTRICPDQAIASVWQPDILIVPAIADLDVSAMSGSNMRAFVGWIGKAHRDGCLVCSISTGAALLAEAGLLRDGRAATHWAFCDSLSQRYPDVKFIANERLVGNASPTRVVTAAEGTAWQELVTYLIRCYADALCARQVSKTFGMRTSTGPTIAEFVPRKDHGDLAVCRAQDILSERFTHRSVLATAVRASGLPIRSFERRFARATGMTPIRYLQQIRISEAKLQLEINSIPVQQIAEDVGYCDLPSFRKLFRRLVGVTPGEYRTQQSVVGLSAAQAPSIKHPFPAARGEV